MSAVAFLVAFGIPYLDDICCNLCLLPICGVLLFVVCLKFSVVDGSSSPT